MKSGITTNEVRTYYDNFLSYLKYDHTKDNPRHIKIKKDLRNIIGAGMDVLDLGCGTGVTTKYIAELGAKVIGIDISPKLIEFARENSSHENIKYLVGDVTDFNLGKKVFEVICLIDMMEHIPKEKIPDLIKNINRYSHDNTIVYLNIPDARLQFWMKKNHPEKLQIVDEAYFMANILFMFSSIGFEVIKIKIYGVDFPLQYTSYVFVREDIIFNNYNKYFNYKNV